VTVMVFLGGFSAAISMIIVSSISLATMLSNNLLIPYGFIGSLENSSQEKNSKRIVNSRKLNFSLIILAYAIYRLFILDYSLVSIGLVAFVVIAQLAPSFLSFGDEAKMALSPESFSDLLFVFIPTNSVCNRHDKFSQSL
jgi:hypothetical protein